MLTKEDIQNYINKNVGLKLTDGYYYEGQILQVTDSSFVFFDKKKITYVFRIDTIYRITFLKEV